MPLLLALLLILLQSSIVALLLLQFLLGKKEKGLGVENSTFRTAESRGKWIHNKVSWCHSLVATERHTAGKHTHQNQVDKGALMNRKMPWLVNYTQELEKQQDCHPSNFLKRRGELLEFISKEVYYYTLCHSTFSSRLLCNQCGPTIYIFSKEIHIEWEWPSDFSHFPINLIFNFQYPVYCWTKFINHEDMYLLWRE